MERELYFTKNYGLNLAKSGGPRTLFSTLPENVGENRYFEDPYSRNMTVDCSVITPLPSTAPYNISFLIVVRI